MVESDTDAVLELMKDLAIWHDQLEYVKITEDTFVQHAFGPEPLIEACVAEAAGVLVGYVSFTRNFSIWAGRTFLAIDDVFVKSEFRSCGVGERMMRYVQQVAKSAGIDRIRWEAEKDNNEAIRFYQRLGAEHKLKAVFNWAV